VKLAKRPAFVQIGGMTQPQTQAESWAVIGAGAIGLSVARRLADAGRTVTVYERDGHVGGQAASFEIEPGVKLERFYHHAFKSDQILRRTYAELGLAGSLTWTRPLTATLLQGEIQPLDSAASLLKFEHLPRLDRLRMGATLAALRILPRGGLLEARSAGRWLRRWMGRPSYEQIWRPLFEGKFGAAAEDVAMPWFWARVHDRTSVLGYPLGGFQPLYEALADRIRASGGAVQLNTTVESLERAPTGYLVHARDAGGQPMTTRHDGVVSTLPPRITSQLASELPGWWRDRFASAPSRSALCLILALDRPLTDSYWLNVNDPGYPFIVVVEHTNFRSPAEYGGRHLIYLGSYRDSADPMLKLSTDQLVDAFMPHLARINPAVDNSWIIGRWSFTAADAQPIVGTDFRDRIPPFETPLPSLFTATIAQVYPHDRGQNYAIGLGERLASRLLEPAGGRKSRAVG
jgi:protoporphyrinogen oxidase